MLKNLIVLLAIGLGAAWGVCRFTTPSYEARCECEVSFGRPSEGGFEETLNTRLAAWQSALGDALEGVEVERVPRARLVALTARGARAEDVAARANAGAEALVSYVEKANAARARTAIESIHAEVERQRQADERLDRQILASRTANASEGGASARRHLEESLARTESDVLEQEKRVRQAGEWVAFLEVARTRPKDLGAFPASVPEESEVRRAHKAWSAARGRLNNLRTKYTEAHPEVDAAKNVLISTAKQFAEALVGASAVAEGELTVAQNQLKAFRQKASRLRAELEGMEIRTTEASGGIERLQQEKQVVRALYEELLLKENEVRIAAGQDVDRVRVVRAAIVPARPVRPDPVAIYSVGAGAPVLLWFLLGLLWPSAPRHRRHSHHRHASARADGRGDA